MENKNNRQKELTVYRCPHCHQLSHAHEWVLLEQEGSVQCPKCSLSTSSMILKRIHVELLRRGRIWVDTQSHLE